MAAARPFQWLLLAASVLVAGCSGSDPVAPPLPGALAFTELHAGYAHTCGLTRGGSVFCWGGNSTGALGDGTRIGRTRPGPVAAATGFRALTVGAAHTCALTSGGRAWCWGQNDEGQVGDGTFTQRSAPAEVAGPAMVQISAGHAHSCGLTAEGSVYCWGDDSQGQLGDGGPGAGTKASVPVRVQAEVGFTSVRAGYYQTCALTEAGAAWCWGLGSSGQNGDGTEEARHVPVRVSGGVRFEELAVGDRFVCGRAGAATWCWGALVAASVPQPMSGFPQLTGIAAAIGASTIPGAQPYACGVRSGRSPWCWGGAVRGLRPEGASALASGRAAHALATGAEHVCVLTRGGYAWCGGENNAGQLGDGSTTDRAELVPVVGAGS